MAIQLGQAFIALHADGAALAGEVRAQMEAALAEAQGTAVAASGAGAAEGGVAAASGVTAAAEEAAAALDQMGAAGVAANGQIAASSAEADAAIGRMITAGDEAATSWKGVGASAVAASDEAAAASDKAAAGAGRMAAATDGATKSAGLLGMSWKTVGEFAGGAAVYEAIKAAGDYQQQLTRLVTSANEAVGNVKMVGQGMLNMGSQVGISANQLAQGMYIVESAGYHGAAGLTTLKASAEIARQENASLQTTTQAVTTTMRDFGIGADGAATVASKLNEAVAFGKTNLQDFSSALHSVEPNAAAAHIKLEDVLGSLATMTNSGMSAQQAAQNLAHTLSNFEKPSQPMTMALAQIGLNTQDLMRNLGRDGLSGTLIEVSNAIKDHMGPDGQIAVNALNQNKQAAQALVDMMQNMPPQVADMSNALIDGSMSIKDYRTKVRELGGEAGAMGMQFLSLYQSQDGFNSILKAGGPQVQQYLGYLARSTGTVDALRTALLLTSDGGAKVTQAIAGIRDVSAQADGNVSKWALTQQTFNQKFSDAKAAVENFGVEMGSKLLPILTAVAGWVADHLVPAAQSLAHELGQLASSNGVQDAFKVIMVAAGLVGAALMGVISAVSTLVGWFTQLPSAIQTALVLFAAFKIAMSTDFFGLFKKYGAEAAGAATKVGTAAAESRAPLAELGAAATATGDAAEAAAGKTTGLAAAWSDLKAKAASTAASIQASAAEVRAAYAEAAAGSQVTATEITSGAEEVATVGGGKMAGFTGALKNVAKQGFGGLKSAASGAFSAMGGMTTVALIGVTTAIQLYSEGQAENTRIVKSATDAGNNLFATYVKLGNIYGDAAMQARDIVRQQQGLNDVQYQAGISADTMTQALQGNVAAQKKAEASADSLHNRWFALGHDINSGNWGAIFSGNFMNNNSDKLKALFDGLDGVNTKMGQFNRIADQGGGSLAAIESAANKVWGPGNIFASQTNAVDAALEKLPAAGNDVGKQMTALQGIWAGVSADQKGQAAATIAQTNALDQVGHAFDNVGKSAFDAKGNIDLTTKSGADLYSNLQQIATGAQNATDAAFKAAGGNANLAASSKAAGDAMGKDYQAFLQAATAAGMSTEQAQQLAAKLGLIPGSVATQILQPGMTLAQVAADTLRGKITEIPGSKDVRVDALTQDAIGALDAAGYTVTHLPDGTFQIHANTATAAGQIQGLIGEYQNYQINVGLKLGVSRMAAAEGAIWPGHAFADGGLEPMAQGVPQIVGPNTWRIIGDRAATDEAYIPLDGSPRSVSLWGDAGRRMGLLGAGSRGSGGRVVQVTYAPQYTLPPAADPNQVAAMVGANTARDFQMGMESLSSMGWATS